MNPPTIIRKAGIKLTHNTPVWRWRHNFRRTLLHNVDLGKPGAARQDLRELRRDGITLRNASDFFDDSGNALLTQIRSIADARLQDDDTQAMLQESHSGDQRKEYVYNMMDGDFSVDDPFIQLAVHPSLLGIASSYLGMKCFLANVNLWVNFLTPVPPKETQLWHRDPDDWLILKVFIYLSDVTETTGPFCFVPETHLRGPLQLKGFRGKGRVTDEEMMAEVPAERWQVNTGPAGTIVFADTTGFHRGLKPVDDHRILLQYV